MSSSSTSSASSSSLSVNANVDVDVTNNLTATTTSTNTLPTSNVNNKMTPAQQSSLAALKSHLTCALCAQPYGSTSVTSTSTDTDDDDNNNRNESSHEPAILMACMHTFCRFCITTHMENDWQCPLSHCRKSVTNFGSSSEVIKTNPIYSAVCKSLYEIERIMSTAPDNWWLTSCNNNNSTANNNSKIDYYNTTNDTEEEEKKKEEYYDEESVVEKEEDDEDEEEMEVVDFTHTVNDSRNDQDNNNDDNNDNDESSISKCKEHTTGGEVPSSSLACVLPVNDDDDDEGEGKRGTATASQLDRILNHDPSASKTLSSPTSLVVLSTTYSTPSLGTATIALRSNHKKRSSVTFQSQPKILPLIPTSKWNAEHSRQLRKWITDGRASLLSSNSGIDISSSSSSSLDNNDAGRGIGDEGEYNFDDEGVAESFLSLLSSSSSAFTNNNDDAAAVPILSYYAISIEKDPNFSFDKSVIVVPRSFMYYLVVACGLPIVDVDFLSSAAAALAMNQRGRRRSPMSMTTTTTRDNNGGQRYPFPTNDDPYLIQGATNYTWGAPIKARMAAMERYTMWRDCVGPYATSGTLRPGTDLLCNYIVILIGDYDPPALLSSSSQQIRGKRKRGGKSPAKNADDEIGYRTRGNIGILLRLCGAIVYDVTQFASSKQIQKGLNEDQLFTIMNSTSLGGTVVPALEEILDNSKRGVYNKSSNLEPPINLLVMVKDESDIQTVGHEFVKKMLKTGDNVYVPLVSSMWLFNSIGEFQVQSIS